MVFTKEQDFSCGHCTYTRKNIERISLPGPLVWSSFIPILLSAIISKPLPATQRCKEEYRYRIDCGGGGGGVDPIYSNEGTMSASFFLSVLGIRDILMRIRFPRSVLLTNGSGS
jgi:hypothetical protein